MERVHERRVAPQAGVGFETLHRIPVPREDGVGRLDGASLAQPEIGRSVRVEVGQPDDVDDEPEQGEREQPQVAALEAAWT